MDLPLVPSTPVAGLITGTELVPEEATNSPLIKLGRDADMVEMLKIVLFRENCAVLFNCNTTQRKKQQQNWLQTANPELQEFLRTTTTHTFLELNLGLFREKTNKKTKAKFNPCCWNPCLFSLIVSSSHHTTTVSTMQECHHVENTDDSSLIPMVVANNDDDDDDVPSEQDNLTAESRQPAPLFLWEIQEAK